MIAPPRGHLQLVEFTVDGTDYSQGYWCLAGGIFSELSSFVTDFRIPNNPIN